MAEIRYRFVATGYESVRNAFKSIDQAARESKKAVDATMGAIGRTTGRVGGAAGGGGGGGAGGGPTWRENQLTKLARQVERDQLRAAKREEQLAARTGAKVIREAEKQASAKQRAAEKAERAAAKAVERENAARERVRNREARNHERHMERMNRTQERAIKRGQEIVEQGQERRLAHIGRQVSGAVITGGAAAIGTGAALVGAAARDDIRLRDASRRIAINARGAGEAMTNPDELARQFHAIATATPGIKSADVAEAVSSYVAKTGDLATARTNAATWATTASATGASIADVSKVAADMAEKFGIKSADEMQKAMATLTFQGKTGAFEFANAASEFPEMAAAASRFGLGKGAGAVATLGGLAQIARTANGSAAETSTSLGQMFNQLTAKADKIGAAGVDVFDKEGNGRDITKILPELIGAKGTDLAAMKGFMLEMLDVRGVKAVSPLMDTYAQAVSGTKGTEAEKVAAGMAAVSAQLDRAINAAGKWSDVVDDAAEAQKAVGAGMSASWEKLTAAVGDQVTPQLLKLFGSVGNVDGAIEALAGAAGVAAEALVWLADKLGWTKPRTDQQRRDEAQKEYDKIAAKGLDTTADDIKRMGELSATLAALDEKANPSAEAGQRSNLSRLSYATPDDFAKAYLGASGFDGGGNLAAADMSDAAKVAAQIREDPNYFTTGRIGETPEQAAIRENYQAQVTAERAGVPGSAPTINADEANKSLAAVSGAAAAAAEALSKLKLPGSGASIIADG